MLTIVNEEDIRLLGLLSNGLFWAKSLKTKTCTEPLPPSHLLPPMMLKVCLCFLDGIFEAPYIVSAACANMSACLTSSRLLWLSRGRGEGELEEVFSVCVLIV